MAQAMVVRRPVHGAMIQQQQQQRQLLEGHRASSPAFGHIEQLCVVQLLAAAASRSLTLYCYCVASEAQTSNGHSQTQADG